MFCSVLSQLQNIERKLVIDGISIANKTNIYRLVPRSVSLEPHHLETVLLSIALDEAGSNRERLNLYNITNLNVAVHDYIIVVFCLGQSLIDKQFDFLRLGHIPHKALERYHANSILLLNERNGLANGREAGGFQ